jgi:hypothetical protein
MIRLKRPQARVFRSKARFRVLVAGRRFGKTFLSQIELCQAAWGEGRVAWYVAPTYKQAKRIVWKPLKELTRPYWASKPNESDLRIELITGGTIALRGADNYDSLRGSGLDFLVLDEYASMAREAWMEVLRPALADRIGRALFIGTPQGYNHFFDLYEAAADQPDWDRFQFTTEDGGNVPREEIEAATHELDERTYRQEFQARFENLTAGRAYFAFDRSRNVKEVPYNPNLPIFWTLDFNVNPMASLIGQRDGNQIYVLDELVLPNSNTWDAWEEFLSRTESWITQVPLRVSVYGDATGKARDSTASRTDWQIVRESFGRYSDRFYPTFRIPNSDPRVKDRVYSVNGMLRNQAGERRLSIHPRCKELIKDLEQVAWKIDPSGNTLSDVDDSNKNRTHLSDALGYMLNMEFGIRAKSGERSGSFP